MTPDGSSDEEHNKTETSSYCGGYRPKIVSIVWSLLKGKFCVLDIRYSGHMWREFKRHIFQILNGIRTLAPSTEDVQGLSSFSQGVVTEMVLFVTIQLELQHLHRIVTSIKAMRSVSLFRSSERKHMLLDGAGTKSIDGSKCCQVCMTRKSLHSFCHKIEKPEGTGC